MTAPLDLATEDPAPRASEIDALSRRQHEITDAHDERSPTAEHPVIAPAPGCRIDRYVILRALGRTRHADIYAAHDPQLDRKVAVKLLSVDTVDEDDGYRRLMAEAQATARLAHANVVKVHDVGTWNGRPYVAREFVEGASVHTWKHRRRPARAEVLRVMLQAGQGLAALHAAGLVHRDINLHAILVGDDGSVRVTDMDFVGSVEALALPSTLDGEGRDFDSREMSMDSRDYSLESREIPVDLLSSSGEDTTGTYVRAAGVSGVFEDSPYVSPEQLLGRVADARSDQFSFCVALYEALFDRTPFGRGTAARRLLRIEAGRVRVPRCRFSRRTFNALKRGLAADPGDRFPNMASLLRALTPRRHRFTLLAPIAVGAATVAAVALVPEDEPAASYCASAEDKLEGVWDAARSERVRESFLATELPYAEDLYSLTTARLDAWVDKWKARHDELCAEQGEEAVVRVAREMHCLALRRAELGAVVDTLEAGDKRSIENAARIVRDLNTVESCADPKQWVASRDHAEEATQLGRGLRRAATLMQSGRFDEAETLTSALVDQARILGHGPSLVWALTLRASTLDNTRSPEAEAALHEALSEALAQGEYSAVADAATMLAQHLLRDREFEQARHWLDHAEAALARVDEPGSPMHAGIESVRARISTLEGDYQGALDSYRRSLELRRTALGPDDERVALHRINVGQAYQDLGRYGEARREYEAALEGIEDVLGKDHPDVGRAHMALCSVLALQGETDPALEHGAEAERVLERVYGPVATVLADAKLSTAMAYSKEGRVARSVEKQLEALDIYKKSSGDRSYRVSLVLNNLGVENHNSGKYEEAEQYYRDALEIAEEVLGKEHVRASEMRSTLASALVAQKKYDESALLLTDALADMERQLGTDHPRLAHPLTYAAELDAVAGKHGDAINKLQRAVRLSETADGSETDRGQFELMLATELRFVGRIEEADVLRDEVMRRLQSAGSPGANAIAEAGRFRQRVTTENAQ